MQREIINLLQVWSRKRQQTLNCLLASMQKRLKWNCQHFFVAWNLFAHANVPEASRNEVWLLGWRLLKYLRCFQPASRPRHRQREKEKGQTAALGWREKKKRKSRRRRRREKHRATWIIPAMCVLRLWYPNKRLGLLCHHWLLLGGALSLNA